MRITKVYTRRGDKGTTRLVGGQEISKDDLRTEGYGTVDELNSVVGIVRVELQRATVAGEQKEQLDGWLSEVQNDLFNLGGDLATRTEDRWEGMRLVNSTDVARLESQIDAMNAVLVPLEEFILPGGGPVAAFLHQARTVCRRGERRVVSLAAREDLNPLAVEYLNRLSDWLFVAGRWAARAAGEPEVHWDREH